MVPLVKRRPWKRAPIPPLSVRSIMRFTRTFTTGSGSNLTSLVRLQRLNTHRLSRTLSENYGPTVLLRSVRPYSHTAKYTPASWQIVSLRENVRSVVILTPVAINVTVAVD